MLVLLSCCCFFFQAEDGIRDLVRSRGLGDVYKRQIKDRFPVPRVIETDQHKSQARFLLAKLNPSVTHANPNGPGPGQPASELIFTDDVSLQAVSYTHLTLPTIDSV
eukprot:TRINITY_DN23082_c0_g1_i1.p1 TRINITY_DN23082_c0_g1~~TRINITY_DN23082_c0_g1_i1.p1  ORF type:complete len:107 (-),score=35.13 TRINITY_DN23082_c0_g1_i1:83-403(-)